MRAASHIRAGAVLLLLGEAYLGGWAWWRLLEPDNLAGILSLFALC